MWRLRKRIFYAVFIGCLFLTDGASADEPVTKSVTIKMVLRNNQVKFIRQAKGEIVSVKLTDAQKKLIRLKSPDFKGLTIRLSTEHLKKGTNKISLKIIKPSSYTPILRVLPPLEP